MLVFPIAFDGLNLIILVQRRGQLGGHRTLGKESDGIFLRSRIRCSQLSNHRTDAKKDTAGVRDRVVFGKLGKLNGDGSIRET